MAKGKKQEDPNKVAQRKAERVAFVQSHPNLAPEVARQRYYVQTRAAELEAAGKQVDRAALREKFQTGGVTREGFYTPADVTRFNSANNGSSLADSKSTSTPPVVSNVPVAPSATNVPTPVRRETSSVKTPSSSYQAPQTTTSLGQVVQPPTSYMDKQPGTPVRGGEPGRGVTPPALVRPQGTPVPGGEPRPPVWASGEPVIGNITRPGQMYAAEKNDLREFKAATARVSPQAPANPKALRQQQQTRWQTVDVPRIQAQMRRDNPIYAARQAKIDAGFVEAPYDWTNLYKTAAGGTVIAAEMFGMRGGPVGGALAAGTAYNLTNRLGNLLEQKTGFGGVEGDPGFKGDTSAKGFAIIAGGSLAGSGIGALGAKAISKIPGIPSAIGKSWRAVQKWADDTPQVPATPWKEAGAGSPGISTGITPRTPWREGPITGGSKSPRRVGAPKVEVETPKPTKIDLPGETQTESGIIIPAPSTRARAGRTAAENQTLDEMAATNYNAFDAVTGKKGSSEPLSLGESKAATTKAMAEDGVEELTPRQIAARKGAATRKANKEAALKLQETNVEVKGPEPTNLGDEFGVVHFGPKEPQFSEIDPRTVEVDLTAPENKHLFNDKGERIYLKYEHDPSIPKDEWLNAPEPAVTAPEAPNKLARKPFETNAQYDSRMRAETLKNSGSVTKIDAGMDLPRLTGKDKVVGQVEAGMSRSNRLSFVDDMSGESRPRFGVVQGESPERLAMMRNHPAFTSKLPESPANLAEVKAPRMRDRFADINAAGEFDAMTPQGFPMSEPGETVRQFNERVNRFQAARGKPTVSQEGNYPVSGAAPEAPTQAPKSLEGNVEPKRPSVNKFGQRLKAGAKINPDTGEFHNVKIDPTTGEEAFVMPRVKGQQRTNAEKQAAKRLNQKVAVEVKEVPGAVKGEFTFAGETIQGTKTVLPRGVSGTGKFVGENIPSDSSLLRMSAEERVAFAQANPKMDIEGWASKNLSPDEQQLFKNLRDAQGTRASRRVAEPVKGKRAMKPGSELAAYEQRYTEILKNQGEINHVSFMRSKQQVALEREIENAFGTDAMVALRNRFATAAESIPTSGIGVEAAPASFSEVLPSQLPQELPVKPGGNLREQAAQLFNKDGLLKGKTGPGRARRWQQVKESSWFRELVAKEPTFANYLMKQNADLAAGYRDISLSQGIGGPRTPRLMGQERYAGKLTEEQAAAQIAREELRTANAATSTGALAESRDARRATSQLFPAEDAAFGQINQARIARETGVSLTPEQQSVLKDFGVLDPSGSLTATYSDIAAVRREIAQPIRPGTRVAPELSNEVLVARKQAFYDQFGEAPAKDKANSKGWMKDQWLQKKEEYMGALMDAPATSTILNPEPFSTRIDPNLVDPNMPIRPEAIENASKWRAEQQKAAVKAAEKQSAQAKLTAETEAARKAGLLKEPNIDDFLNPRPARNVPPPTLEQMKQRFLIEEQTRREGLARAAAKAKAASFEVKTNNPFEQLGKYDPKTDTYIEDILHPTGSVMRIETKLGIGPPSPQDKTKFFIQERNFSWPSRNESAKMTASEAEALMEDFKKTELTNMQEVLKDWMSGD